MFSRLIVVVTLALLPSTFLRAQIIKEQDLWKLEGNSAPSDSSIPVISKVVNAFGDSSTIAPNTWVIIKGTDLALTERIWQVSDFTSGQMPTTLDSVSVTMGGKRAFIYYVSRTQINLL